MKNDILQQFSKYTIREIVEVLDEVFGRRMKPDEKKEKFTRWFTVSYSGPMNSDYKGFIYDPDLGVEVRSMAQPLITFYENEEYYESGICDICGLEVVCTHKYARCPYCFSDVGCS